MRQNTKGRLTHEIKVPDDVAVRVEADAMRSTVEGIFRRLKLPAEDARRAADVLIYADLHGIESHGVSNMMKHYVTWIADGTINPIPKITLRQESPAGATMDSDSGLGLAVAPLAMELAIEKARHAGVGAVIVADGTHFGAAGYHAALALPHDMIGIAMTVGGLFMVPTFAAKAMLGVNPIAVAVPTREEIPFIFDASTSSVAVNKIFSAQRLGMKIPPGWIADAEGTPIMHETHPPENFRMVPIGGTREMGSHKGYGLAVMIDVLSGLLTGHTAGFQRKRGEVSHHLLAYRIDAFTELEAFKDHMDVYLKSLREAAPAPGHDRVLYAGLLEYETAQDRRQNGIPYHPDVIRWHRETAERLGVDRALG